MGTPNRSAREVEVTGDVWVKVQATMRVVVSGRPHANDFEIQEIKAVDVDCAMSSGPVDADELENFSLTPEGHLDWELQDQLDSEEGWCDLEDDGG